MTTLGVVGSGTMGAGIAETALTNGFDVVLYDPVAAALEGAGQRIESGIRAGEKRGLWDADHTRASLGRLMISGALSALAHCELVVEAGPERLGIKQRIFRELEGVVGPDAILASNTSSIPVTAIAAALERPQRVLGLHFFNPVPRMKLVEVISAEQTSEATAQRTTEIAEQLGKTAIPAPDSPGFLVNRCGRPFYLESLRILQERGADVAQIDRVCRIGGGFRMGPFELMDLVGIDVNFAVAQSFIEVSFGEPRWRPTTLQARMAASGNLGRKSGRGWYVYTDGAYRPDDPASGSRGGGAGRSLAVIGDGVLATHIRELATAAGYAIARDPDPSAVATVFAEPHVAADEIRTAPCPIVSCATHSLAARRLAHRVGFNVPNLPGGGRVAELTQTSLTDAADTAAAAELFTNLGVHVEWVGDGPGLVLGRLLAAIVNESAFAHGEGVGATADIDAGVKLGLNYPRGPLEWGGAIGWNDVVETLEGIWNERHEERYRVAPALHAAAAGVSMR